MPALWLLARWWARRRLRTLVTALATTVGVAAVLGVQLCIVALDSQASTAQTLRAGRSDIDVHSVASGHLEPDTLVTLAATPGVASVDPLEEKRVDAYPHGSASGARVVTLVALSDAQEVGYRSVALVAGRLPKHGARDEVAIDGGVADALGQGGSSPLHVGDTVDLTTATGPDRFTVVGLTAGTVGGTALTRSAAFVSGTAAHGPFSLGLHTELAAVRVGQGRDAATVAAAIRERLGAVVTTTLPRVGTAEPLRDLRPLLMLMTVLSLAVGAGVTANTVALGTLERRREIGLLRAAGASRRMVVRTLLLEALLTAGLGVVAGIGLGIALAAVLVHLTAPPDLGIPPLALSVPVLLAAVGAGVAASVLGACGPIVTLGRSTSLVLLRNRAAGGNDRPPRLLGVIAIVLPLLAAASLATGRAEGAAAGVALVLAALAAALPWLVPALTRGLARLVGPVIPSARVAAANLVRRRNRAALALAGVATSVATATAIAALVGGALGAGDDWISSILVGDSVVASPATANDAVARDITTQTGGTAGRIRLLSAPVDGAVTGIAAVDLQPYQDRHGLDIVDGDRAAAFDALATGPAAIVPQTLVDAAGWRRGQALDVVTGDGAHVTVAVAAVARHTLPAGDGRETILLSHDEAVRLLGDVASGFDDLQVSGAPAARIAAVAANFGMSATPVSDITSAARRSVEHSLDVLVALGWLGISVSMLAVVTTLAVDIRQGTRELALLRAVGLSRRDALRLVLLEAGMLGVVGTALGVALGVPLSVPLLRAAASPTFTPAFSVPLATIGVVAISVVASSLIAAVAPARTASRASIVTAMRYE